MDPRLVAIDGPLNGASFPLPNGDFTVGRDAGCQLRLDDDGASRRHCVIRRSGERFTLQDLGSHNGTLVNGTSTVERDLISGDEVQIGRSRFLFLTTADSVNDSGPDTKTIELYPTEALYLPSSDRSSRLPDSVRTTADLECLLRVSILLSSFRSFYAARSAPARERLSQHLLSLLLEIIPAGRGEVLVAEQARACSRESGRGFLGRVLDEKIALRLDDAVLAAPLLVQNEVVAILCLEASGHRFDERHLELLVAVAGMAAVAWENAGHFERLQEENALLQADLQLEHEMVGDSPVMRELQSQVARVGRSAATVLILGESGTGKELVARAIHRSGPRASQPFLAINCAALGDALLESELCGHEKGAFTGAIARKKGKLEIAEGGTVFLDEIGELASPLQSRLLRVLQEREFERVGGTSPIKVDIRLVAASNRDLKDAVGKGTFRQDLYYRLNVVTLHTPPLRERSEDILPLAAYFVRKYAPRCGRKVAGISPAARAYLQSHAWPGNVRELENAIERAIVLGSTDVILPEDLPEHIREAPRPQQVPTTLYAEAVETAKRQVILKAFERARYHHEAAARLLGLHPNYLHRLIRTMDLKAMLKHSGHT